MSDKLNNLISSFTIIFTVMAEEIVRKSNGQLRLLSEQKSFRLYEGEKPIGLTMMIYGNLAADPKVGWEIAKQMFLKGDIPLLWTNGKICKNPICCNPICGKCREPIDPMNIKIFDKGETYHWYCSPCIICRKEIDMLKGHLNSSAGRCHWGACLAEAIKRGLM